MGHDLPQRATPHEMVLRRQALARQRETYRWRHIPGLPAQCDGVPECEKQPRWMRENIGWDLVGSVSEKAVSVVKRIRRNPEKVSQFGSYYSLRRRPKLSINGRWRTDAEFGRQRLGGINPYQIHRIDEIPENFAVTNHVLPESMRGATLERLLDEHRLYMVDYAALDGVPVRTGRFGSAPMALFWVDDEKWMMPVALQLTQEPSAELGVFTPDDDAWLWQRVKADLQSADAAYHEVVAHLFRTHLVMEPIWVAAARTLPRQHPLHELLAAHFTGTIAINDVARTTMIVPGGPIDEAASVGSDGTYWLLSEELDRWSFADCHPLVDLDARGVDNADALPGYYYRDDARLHWAAIDKFVGDLLRIFYQTDQDVADDDELQAWALEMSDPGRGCVNGLPLDEGRFATFDALRATVSQIVFCVSAEHSAVNNGQWDILGYVPNAPGAMWTPPPTEKRPSSEAEFCAAMPLPHAIGEQMMLAHLLSTPTVTRIGTYDRQWFNHNHQVRRVLDRFRADRDAITETIAARNSSLDIPYEYLDPRRVARSIAI